jgi:hypothetical protein
MKSVDLSYSLWPLAIEALLNLHVGPNLLELRLFHLLLLSTLDCEHYIIC